MADQNIRSFKRNTKRCCSSVYLDETYFTKVRSKLVTKDGKKLRGISRNKIGVGVACNETKSFL